MSKIAERFYKGRVALNVLARDIGNAKEVFEASEGMYWLAYSRRIMPLSRKR